MQSILAYFGINEDALMFNDSIVMILNETDGYLLVPLDISGGDQWNLTVNVTNEETNKTTPVTFVGDFAVVSAYVHDGEVMDAG